MLFHITVMQLDMSPKDCPDYVFAVHAPEDTPERIIQQACIDQYNAAIQQAQGYDPDDIWDGQLDDPTCLWVINPVDPARLSAARVAQYRRQLGLGLGVPPYEPFGDEENRKRTFMPRPKGPRDKR